MPHAGRLLAALLCAALIYCIYGAAALHQALRETEDLLWAEFDAALDGTVRMLALAESAPAAPAPLLAAYEYSLALDRLAAAAARLLERRGVRGETFRGYVLSLSGGVRSLCEEARRHGVADALWAGEIRRRLAAIRTVLNPAEVRPASPAELQRRLDALVGAAGAGGSFVGSAAAPGASACAVALS